MSNDVEDDIDEITTAEPGKRKKKKNSLTSHLIGGKPSTVTDSPAVQPLATLPEEQVKELKVANEKGSASNSGMPNTNGNVASLTPLNPVVVQSSSQTSSEKTGGKTTEKSSSTSSISNDNSLLPNGPKTLPSENAPIFVPQPKLSEEVISVSRLASTSSTASLTTSIPKSAGEPIKKTTPRPLPAHLKQAFSSNSPRTSLANSTVHSLTDELIKSMSTMTAIGNSDQPQSFIRKVCLKDVRSRSYLFGCLGSQLSLGGKPELEYYFPDRLLRIYAGTFNMGAAKILPKDVDFDNFALPDYAASDFSSIAPHIFVFSTQESISDRKRWLVKLQESLGQHFVCFCSPSFGSLGMAIFIRRELIWYASAPVEATAWPKPFQPIATKGSLAISFELFGTSLLFINSHFSAGEGNVEARIEDYRRAILELRFQRSPDKSAANQPPKPLQSSGSGFFNRRVLSATVATTASQDGGQKRPTSADETSTPRDLSSSGIDITTQFDCVFWMGDFNFRVLRAREQVDQLIQGIHAKLNSVHPIPENAADNVSTTNSHEVLLEHDEMSIEMSRGRLFTGFNEGRIRFMPSYKFDIGSNNYDTSLKLRIQSYTDRIIFRTRRKNAVTCLAYSSVESVTTSDHKPIYGVYDVELRPGLDVIPTGAGCFDRELYLEGIRQRTHPIATDKSSAVCSIQ